MSNGRFHRRVGAATGAISAWVAAHDQPLKHRVIETLGGIPGGIIGAMAPDLIDPPTSPRHRSIGHGVIPIGALGFWSIWNLRRWQDGLREMANGFQEEYSRETTNGFRRFCLGVAEVACRLAAGAIAGLLGGYASHLALDALTPAGLPWLA